MSNGFPHPGGLRRGACSHTRRSFDFSDGSKQRANLSDRRSLAPDWQVGFKIDRDERTGERHQREMRRV
jgi:hypothetical protein